MRRRLLITVVFAVSAGIAGLLLLVGYLRNFSTLFYASTLLIIVSLPLAILSSQRLRRNFIWVGGANTVALVLVSLLVADSAHYFGFLNHRDLSSEPPPTTFSYREAQGNPRSFRRWWNAYVSQWYGVHKAIQQSDPTDVLPYVVKRNSTAQFFECEMKFNNHGFRGRPTRKEKQGQYRIIAIGESTTMGATIGAEDETWPVMLERLLNEHVAEHRKVEIINAGLSAYDLKDNLSRLSELLTFQPDMIISYHGWNGFRFLPVARQFPVSMPARPSFHLERIEVLLRHAKRRFRGDSIIEAAPSSENGNSADSSKYAQLYRKLINQVPRDVRLVLLTFNTAVDQHSPADAISFYRGAFYSTVDTGIIANQLHTDLLKNLKLPSNTVVVDSSRGINGVYDDDLFIDMVHFTNKGRTVLSSNIFHGIKETVASDIGADATLETAGNVGPELTR